MSGEVFPVGRYEHPKTGSFVTLVGTQHLSTDPDYYPQMEAFLDNRLVQGDVVHYEAITTALPEKVRGAPKPIQRRHQLLVDARKYEEVAIITVEERHPELALSIQYQDCIEDLGQMENHDYTTLDLARELSGEAIDAMYKVALAKHWHAITWGHPDQDAVPLKRALDSRGRALYERVLIENRNKFALQALENTLADDPTVNVTLLWGEAHLPGLGKGLLRRGYVKE